MEERINDMDESELRLALKDMVEAIHLYQGVDCEEELVEHHEYVDDLLAKWDLE